MRNTGWFLTLAAVWLTACQRQTPAREAAQPVDSAHAASITDSVRAFAAAVALGVTAKGLVAWRTFFADEPAFFMASEGRLVFPTSDSAARAIQSLTAAITHIDLRWGDSLRVDPLALGLALLATPYHETRVDMRGHRVEEDGYFTGIAEHGPAGWQFRNAHWSVLAPPAVVP